MSLGESPKDNCIRKSMEKGISFATTPYFTIEPLCVLPVKGNLVAWYIWTSSILPTPSEGDYLEKNKKLVAKWVPRSQVINLPKKYMNDIALMAYDRFVKEKAKSKK